MRVFGTGSKACLLGSALLFGIPTLSHAIDVHKSDLHKSGHKAHVTFPQVHQISYRVPSGYRVTTTHNAMFTGKGKARHAAGARSWGISCVPYARQVSGILVPGNAWQWWENAAGLYARGDRPEPGSVLNFRANGRMRLGHVAVVTRVVNAREIIVDQANWPNAGMVGGVTHDTAVVDVSEANNWSAVRVELGHRAEFGSVYPTYGFIYNRPDHGIVTASVTRPAPQPRINPVPSDLRPVAERPWQTFEEVAETPTAAPRRINLRVTRAAAVYSR